MRAQALVEVALVTPLLLLLFLGALGLGIMLIDRVELQHAAQEGAVMGATSTGEPCTDALAAAAAVLGRPAASQGCSVTDTTVTVSLHDELTLPVPIFGPSVSVDVAERGMIR